jgi:hypothetical protein
MVTAVKTSNLKSGLLFVLPNTDSCHPDDGGDRFLQISVLKEPHNITSKNTALFIVTAVKNLKPYMALTG